MTPEVILRELGKIQIGDIILETTDGAKLALRRVARPNGEPARIWPHCRWSCLSG